MSVHPFIYLSMCVGRGDSQVSTLVHLYVPAGLLSNEHEMKCKCFFLLTWFYAWGLQPHPVVPKTRLTPRSVFRDHSRPARGTLDDAGEGAGVGCAPGGTLILSSLQLYIYSRMSVLVTANRCCVLVSCVVGLGPDISIQCAGPHICAPRLCLPPLAAEMLCLSFHIPLASCAVGCYADLRTPWMLCAQTRSLLLLPPPRAELRLQTAAYRCPQEGSLL